MDFIGTVLAGTITLIVFVILVVFLFTNAGFFAFIGGLGLVGAILGYWHGRTITRQ
ncbi:MAG: hypothetical protein KDC39_11930 [Actinobacteria bacterium]|nr:hypothetical protein [Actinomycetota bacterium]